MSTSENEGISAEEFADLAETVAWDNDRGLSAQERSRLERLLFDNAVSAGVAPNRIADQIVEHADKLLAIVGEKMEDKVAFMTVLPSLRKVVIFYDEEMFALVKRQKEDPTVPTVLPSLGDTLDTVSYMASEGDPVLYIHIRMSEQDRVAMKGIAEGWRQGK